MPQIFQKSTNAISRLTIFGGIFIVISAAWAWTAADRSAYVSAQEIPVDQPVPFSHEHHVSGIGIDCRYCHTLVESGPFAGIPPTSTCMNCHKQVWANSEMLAPVRETFNQARPIAWNRVNDLPDFVYFDHSIHVNKGVGCETCHGRIDKMPLTWKAANLHMEWCINCHRHPDQFLRPLDEIYTMGWNPANQQDLGRRLMKEYSIEPEFKLTNCSVCHR